MSYRSRHARNGWRKARRAIRRHYFVIRRTAKVVPTFTITVNPAIEAGKIYIVQGQEYRLMKTGD